MYLTQNGRPGYGSGPFSDLECRLGGDVFADEIVARDDLAALLPKAVTPAQADLLMAQAATTAADAQDVAACLR